RPGRPLGPAPARAHAPRSAVRGRADGVVLVHPADDDRRLRGHAGHLQRRDHREPAGAGGGTRPRQGRAGAVVSWRRLDRRAHAVLVLPRRAASALTASSALTAPSALTGVLRADRGP